jgi:2-polyprenyl-3-methyl-5-hydroxy-6-metoxy-1,4-benzoquinol methylase
MKLTSEQRSAIARKTRRTHDYYYTLAKLCSDPAYSSVVQQLLGSPLPLLDIGCGLGLLAHTLRTCGYSAPITGIDYDNRKIQDAQRMAADLAHTSFSQGDARQQLPQHTGHVVILDILQFFTPTEQRALLLAAAERVAPGGKFILRSGLYAPRHWRFEITRFCDWLARWTSWMKAAPVCYPSAQLFHEVLGIEAGMQVSVQPLWGRTPFYNHLIIAERSA